MSEHVADREVLSMLRGTAPKDRVLALAAHLESCRACAAKARALDPVTSSAATLARELTAEEHPDHATILTPYAEGTLAASSSLEAHLANCRRCREDVSDLRTVIDLPRPVASRRWLTAALIAAAVVLLAVVSAQWPRRSRTEVATPTASVPAPAPPATVTRDRIAPPPASVAYARTEWADAVREAVRTGTLAMPAALADLQLRADPARGATQRRSDRLSEPAAAILEETRPQFRWTTPRGATSIVSVFEGDRLVAESPRLTASQWRPSRDLLRGATIQWQVEVRDGETVAILPVPPAPPAYFRILDRAAHEELTRARELHPADPLLLGVLYAKHGLRNEAERELARVDSDDGRALLRSVRGWRR